MEDVSSDELVFYVNGTKVVDPDIDPETTILQYLRNKLYLTGSKLGCGEGGCGACTVMVSRYDRHTDKIINYTVNACLAPVCSVHGMAVTTVEGIGSLRDGLHPVQERLAKYHGSQCGFCTPGFVMSMYTLLRNDPKPSMEDIIKSIEGNLCRCTGYRPILEGFKTFSQNCEQRGKCCRNEQKAFNAKIPTQLSEATQLQDVGNLRPYDPSQDPIFPPQLQVAPIYDKNTLVFRGKRVTWFRPTSLDQLLDLRSMFPSAKLVTGNTEIGIEMRIKNMLYPVIIVATHIPEMRRFEHLSDGVSIGSSVTLTEMERGLTSAIDKLDEYKCRSYRVLVEMLQWFAGKQIRNVACVGGNVMTASPISDLNPLFMAAGAKAMVVSKGTMLYIDYNEAVATIADHGCREITMDDQFFTGYRRTALESDEILLSIYIPHTKESEYFQGYKQAHRRDDDIAIVNCGFRICFEANTDVIRDGVLSFGGMAPTTILTAKTGNILRGRCWDESLLMYAVDTLTKELVLAPGAPGGMVNYRRTLAISFFYRFFLYVRRLLDIKGICQNGISVPEKMISGIAMIEQPALRSTQVFEAVDTSQPSVDPIGRPLIHASAYKQTTGEAIYIDDIPTFSRELYVCPVVSRSPRAWIISVDASTALGLAGVVDFIHHVDVPGPNVCGPANDVEIFASKEVTCEGQAIGAIVADSKEQAQRGAGEVRIEYESQSPIVTIQQAISCGSFFPFDESVGQGDPQIGFKQSDKIIEGEIHIGGQDHFYMETQSALALPKGEDGEMELFVSTQNPTGVQQEVANVLSVPRNRIVCRVKRLGGGFGGKEFQSHIVALPAAIAAAKHQRPARCVLDRQEDMSITGGRNPCYATYKVGFASTGRVLALEADLYFNAGNSLDCSDHNNQIGATKTILVTSVKITPGTDVTVSIGVKVMDKALESADNCYNLPHVKVRGHLCKTNLPSNTAFRGFGAPQSMLVMENILSDVAVTLGISQEQIREMNMYKLTDRSLCNMPIEECPFRECWNLVLEKANYEKVRDDIVSFNRTNRWKKRGLSVIPVKMSIGIFETPHLNQGGALVHVYTDGSVLLTHGGTEMGQGLHTKMIQVASRVFGISAEYIFTSEASTSTVPNTTSTAGSNSSDVNGFAVKNACEKICRRLKPFKEDNPEGHWEDWVQAAYVATVSLSATGYYGIDYLNYDKATKTGRLIPYYTCGAALSEVEIDCLTGDHQLLRTEIVMDVGKSLNPAIDIGQIEGAFMQGYGLFALEQCKVTPLGHVLTTGPGTYKIPSVGNIPAEFNVSLLKGGIFEKAVYSSKGIGEPPLALAISVFFAIKSAIMAAREENNIRGVFRLDSPATPERIRMACSDIFTEKVMKTSLHGEADSSWFVTP